MNPTMNGPLVYRRPSSDDGAAIWQLVRESGTLDLNSVYAYLMMCDMFSYTCYAAFDAEQIVGFVIGFRKPAHPDTLFIWQIGVAEAYRGRGIGKGLLQNLLDRQENGGIRFVEATIGPSNQASQQLFLKLAARHKAKCRVSEHYAASQFPASDCHEAEHLYRIGPITTD